MRHGKKLRHLGGPVGLRVQKLRNMVSQLIHHETLTTTYGKAKVIARIAEKMVTLGKLNTDSSKRSAQSFLRVSPHYHATPDHPDITPELIPPRPSDPSDPSYLDPTIEFIPPRTLLPKLFETLGQRYAHRPGGYTRIHKLGRRDRDNAPIAVITLVDGPRDVKFEMISKVIGREKAIYAASKGIPDPMSLLHDEGLSERSRENLKKVLQFRLNVKEATEKLNGIAKLAADKWMVEEKVVKGHMRYNPAYAGLDEKELGSKKGKYVGKLHAAGERMAGMPPLMTGLQIARGSLRKKKAYREGEFEQEAWKPKFLSEVKVSEKPASAEGLVKSDRNRSGGDAREVD